MLLQQQWKQKEYDRKLVEIAVAATLLFVLLAARITRHLAYINGLFCFIIWASVYLYSFRTAIEVWYLPELFYGRVFDGTDRRYYLLLFWTVCTCATLIFCFIVNCSSCGSSTVHRKFFHLTVSLVCISGIQYDFELIWLSAWLMLCIFVIIEVFRCKCVPPWSEYLNNWLLVFVDKQDSPDLILTPIYLLAGIFLPLFLSPIANHESRHLYHFAGVATVGVGDSLAAIVGSRYGRLYWKKSWKTVEGSVAFLTGQYIFTLLACVCYITCDIGLFGIFRILLAAFLCAAVESRLPAMDNLILPLIAYLILF